MNRRGFLTNASALAAASVVAPAAHAKPASGPPLDPAWGAARLWDDGLAEITHYDASQVIYKAPRPHEAVLLTVKEPVNPKLMIKADDPSAPGVIDALKLNMIFDIPTPNYHYHHLVCAQARRDNPARLLRQTAGTQEWCGNTYKEFTTAGGAGKYLWRSYWENEGAGETKVTLDPAHVTEEQLFMALRAVRFSEGLTFRLGVYPSMLTNHAPAPKPVEMDFKVKKAEPFDLEGRKLATWMVEAGGGEGRVLTYRFGAEAPHPLLEFSASDGRSLRLKSLKRDAYWVIKS